MPTLPVAIDSSGAAAGAAAFDKAISSIVASSERVGSAVTDKIGNAFKAVTGTLFSFEGALASVFSIAAGEKAIGIADSFAQLNSRLALFAPEGQRAADIFDALQVASQRARVPVLEMADIYSKNTIAMQRMGFTTNEQIRFSETFAKAQQVSGVSSQNAAQAMYNLSQALNLGRLQGQDFRSIAEEMPPLMRILQDEFHLTAGQLKSLSSEGQLSAEKVVQAVLNGSQKVDGQFQQVAQTAGGAWTQMLGSMEVAFAKAEQKAGVSKTWADAFTSVREAMGGPLMQQAMEVFADGLAKDGEAVKYVADHVESLAAWFRAMNQNVASGDPSLARLKALHDEALKSAEAVKLLSNTLKGALNDDTSAGSDLGAVRNKPVTAPENGHVEALRLQNALIEAQINHNQARELTLKNQIQLHGLVTAAMKAEDPVLAAKLTALVAHTGELQKQKAIGDLSREVANRKLDNELLAAQGQTEKTITQALENQIAIRKAVTPEIRSLNPELARQLESEVLVTEELKRQNKLQAENAAQGKQFGDALGAGIKSLVIDGNSWRDSLQGVLKSFADIFLKLTVIEPLAKSAANAFQNAGGLSGITGAGGSGGGIGSLFSSLLGGGGGADIGPFATTVTAFASGGIFDSPVSLKAPGFSGVMGEAGPEAVMPLKRLSNGALGIQTSGGGGSSAIAPVINISISGGANTSTVEALRAAGSNIVQQAVQAVRSEILRNPAYTRR